MNVTSVLEGRLLVGLERVARNSAAGEACCERRFKVISSEDSKCGWSSQRPSTFGVHTR